MRLLPLLLSLLTFSATAQTWPDKPLKWVVPYAPGGGADTAARIIAPKVGELLGQTIVIDNKPGAGGVIGADAVAKAAPDGYTALFDASAYVVNPSVRKLPFDASSDLIPISLIVVAPQIMVTHKDGPYHTINDLLAAARGNPNKVSYGSAGNATASHLAAKVLEDATKTDYLHIPYKGGALALTDVMAGAVNFYFGNATSTAVFVTGGKVRALAVSAKHRLPQLPQVPTLIELGYADLEVYEWNGLFLPKGTPLAVVERFAQAVQTAMADPKIRERFVQAGVTPVGDSPVAFKAYVDKEMKRWSGLIKAKGIKIE